MGFLFFLLHWFEKDVKRNLLISLIEHGEQLNFGARIKQQCLKTGGEKKQTKQKQRCNMWRTTSNEKEDKQNEE